MSFGSEKSAEKAILAVVLLFLSLSSRIGSPARRWVALTELCVLLRWLRDILFRRRLLLSDSKARQRLSKKC